jgi:hypothetical protein
MSSCLEVKLNPTKFFIKQKLWGISQNRDQMTSALTSEVAQGRKLGFSFFEQETGKKGLYDHTNEPTLHKLGRGDPGNPRIDVD